MDGDDLISGPAAPAVLDAPTAPAPADDSTPDEQQWAPAPSPSEGDVMPWWWPMTTYPGDEVARVWMRKVFSFLIVFGCCGFVLWICQPNLIFRNTLPTGGDMGAHVWGPAYLRDYLLPHFRLSGWTPDWTGGFPAYTFYMVLPSLAIVILNVGLLPTWGILLAIPVFGGLGWLIHRRLHGRVVRGLAFTAATLFFFLSFKVPYDISFKLIAVSGLVLFPAAVWYLGKGLALRAPLPELMAIASLPFLMDKTLFSIFGGNIASTMAGEFCFSISMTAGVFFLGVAARGMVSGKHRVLGASLLAVTLLCHVIPSIYVAAGTLIMVSMRIPWGTGFRKLPGRVRRFPGWIVHLPERIVGAFARHRARRALKERWSRLPASLRWVIPVGGIGGLIAAFWYMPFYGMSAYLDDMGWQKYGLVTSPTGKKTQSLFQFMGYLFPFGPHKVILGGQTTTAEPNMYLGHFFFALAGIGVILSIVMMVRAGLFFSLFGLAGALGFWLMPQDRFWNARILPLYYFCVYMMAAVGVWLLIRLVPRLLDADWGHPPKWMGAIMVGLAAVLGFGLTRPDHQWNIWAQVLAYLCVFGLAAVGVFLVGRQSTEVHWGHPLIWVGLAMVGLSILIGYWLMPHAHSWSNADQFAFYLFEFALIGVGTGFVVRNVAPGPTRQPPPWVGVSTIALIGLLVLGIMLVSIRWMPFGGTVTTDAKGNTTYNWGPLNWGPFAGSSIGKATTVHTTYDGPVRDWVAWNFTGYEGKGAAWTELAGIRDTMANIGQQDGCGRAFWEYSPDLNRFGSPMALMLLPYWTHSCIGSMEGLYMESSSTTPFHFTVQGELSQNCSCAQLWNIFGVDPSTVYKGPQFDLGIQHLQMLGVRYFMASSATMKADAAKDPRLKKLATTGAFDVYQVKGAPLVQGLDALPAVWTNVSNPIHSWAKPAEEWFIHPNEWGVYRAESGPANWPRVTAFGTPKKVAVRPAKVTNITATRDTISFDVDHVGTPVLVKTSYFPDWETSDGAGPYRVAPNLMVVVPTTHHVVLTYGRSKIEVGAWILTFIGLGLLIWLLRTGDPDEDGQPREFTGDLDEDRPQPEPTLDDEVDAESAGDTDREFEAAPWEPEPDEPDRVPDEEPVAEPVGVGAFDSAGPGPPGDATGG